MVSWTDPIDTILAGLAIFRGKKEAGTLPEGVDIRYLEGIVRHTTWEDEGMATARALLRERLLARDAVLTSLRARRRLVERRHRERESLRRALVDLALEAPRRLDQAWWLEALAEHIRTEKEAAWPRLFRQPARRIHTRRRCLEHTRERLVRHLAAEVFPLD